MAIHHIPEGFHSVTPYLIVEDAEALVEFILKTFDAEEKSRFLDSDGKIMNAELRVEGSLIELSDASPAWPALPAALHVYVPDVDATYRKALAAGATSLEPPADKFYGDRSASVRDATGVTWYLATHIENLSAAEIERRATAAAH
jgi:PhnB protein